jgi:hypothetical protein
MSRNGTIMKKQVLEVTCALSRVVVYCFEFVQCIYFSRWLQSFILDSTHSFFFSSAN